MKEKTKNTTIATETEAVEVALVNRYIMQDLRAALLIASLLINLIVFTVWIAMQVTPAYDTAVVGMLLSR